MSILIIMQNRKWFEENAFQDRMGDFWITKEKRDLYDRKLDVENYEKSVILGESVYENPKVEMYEKDDYEDEKWGIKKILNPKDDPEYFI